MARRQVCEPLQWFLVITRPAEFHKTLSSLFTFRVFYHLYLSSLKSFCIHNHHMADFIVCELEPRREQNPEMLCSAPQQHLTTTTRTTRGTHINKPTTIHSTPHYNHCFHLHVAILSARFIH